MFLKKTKFFLFFFLISSTLFSIEKRQIPIKLKTSVIIPCHYKHARLLNEALTAYANQLNVLPDEIVISLSEVNKVDKSIIDELVNKNWPFTVKLIKNDSALAPGANRNNACKMATGDIFICSDADDLPHVQRIEIIKYFFENYYLDHLMNGWVEENTQIPIYQDASKVDWFPTTEFKIFGKVANGPIAMTREVFEKVQWDSKSKFGEDYDFNAAVYKHFNNKIVIRSPLYYYRHLLSSFK